MSRKKEEKVISQSEQETITKKQLHQLHVDLKRGLLPYSILFLLKIRPHYCLEMHKKFLLIAEGHFKIEKNVIYDNLKKFEKRGIVGSYYEKSRMGAKRRYYFLTEFGERIFDEIVVKNLYPLLYICLSNMEKAIKNNRSKQVLLKKEVERVQALFVEMIEK